MENPPPHTHPVGSGASSHWNGFLPNSPVDITASDRMGILDPRRNCIGAWIILERDRLEWAGLGERLGSSGEGTRTRKVAGRHRISSVGFCCEPQWGQQPSHKPLKIFWSQVGWLLSHFLYLMPASSHQCSLLSVLDSMGPPWDSTKNTML